jgi:hypothetical protein
MTAGPSRSEGRRWALMNGTEACNHFRIEGAMKH